MYSLYYLINKYDFSKSTERKSYNDIQLMHPLYM